jgi:fucose permease
MGLLADISMRLSFTMPLACFVYIAIYAAIWKWLERLDTGHDVAD